jgi:hypothetical protein
MAMQTFEEDELTDVKPVAGPPATTSAAAAPAHSKPQPAAATTIAQGQAANELDDEAPTTTAKPAASKAAVKNDNSDIHETDFDDEAIHSRPGVITRIRPDKKKAVRVAFVKGIKMQSAKSHFVELGTGKDAKKGTYRCLTPIGDETPAYCCGKQEKEATVHVAALVIVYKNADAVTGKYVKNADGTFPPIEWELGYLDLSSFNMKQIRKLPDEDQSPYDIDIIMTHAEGRAFGYEFNRASSKARWLGNPEVVKEVQAAAERFKDGKALSSKLGKKLSPLEWKALMTGFGGEEPKLDNMDEL